MYHSNERYMKVKKISAANVEACSLPKLFDEEKIDFQSIQCVNWAEYPYKPKVNFRIAHTQNSILLHFKVKEESVRAKYGKDNGSVWQYRPYRVVLLFSNIKRWVFLRIRSDAFQSACDAASTKIRGWPPKTMPSSHLCVNCFRVSKIVLHGFCTESARFHPVQWLTTGAKFTSGRET